MELLRVFSLVYASLSIDHFYRGLTLIYGVFSKHSDTFLWPEHDFRPTFRILYRVRRYKRLLLIVCLSGSPRLRIILSRLFMAEILYHGGCSLQLCIVDQYSVLCIYLVELAVVWFWCCRIQWTMQYEALNSFPADDHVNVSNFVKQQIDCPIPTKHAAAHHTA